MMRRLPHRPLQAPPPGRLRLSHRQALHALGLAALASGALLLARPWIEQAWQFVLLGWLHALQLPGDFEACLGSGWLTVTGPRLGMPLPRPGASALTLYSLAAAGAWWLGGRLPERWRPWAWLLRLTAACQAVVLLFFGLWPGQLPTSPGPHVDALLHQLWGLMLALPWLHALGRPLLPPARWQRVGLGALALGWLALLAPCLAATHVALLALLGPLAMPLLALLGGAVPVVLGLVAVHAWVLARCG